MTEERDFEKELLEEQETPAYKHGYDLGSAMASYEASEQAQVAYDNGEIELWLDWQRPKSFEEWREWEAEHGDHEVMRARFTRKVDNAD